MASLVFLLPVVLLIAGWAPPPSSAAAAAATFVLDVHHRFSDPVRRWVESRSPPISGDRRWPEKGSVEYYAALAHHDRALRGRSLSDAEPLTFSDGNATIRISSLGYLHYTFVSVGTPSVTFLVALDTGSDLFWLPCDCRSCAPTSSVNSGYEFEFSIYSPNMSSSSQTVPCNSSLCELQSRCSGPRTRCPYQVAYVSDDTSSSGILVEDVLHLRTIDTNSKVVEARIVFGCGQVQTGSFLDAAAPNGLFGLGMEKISVPSILSSTGLTSDSFSMCFGRDGIGRISFGDNGSSDQDETPFNIRQSHPSYNVSVTGIVVGNNTLDVDISALIDSGTSFTYLAEPAYTRLSRSFNAQVQDKPYKSDSQIPFEHCYHVSSNNKTIQLPRLVLMMKGGKQFPVTSPIIIVSIQEHQYVYCLAVVKSSNLNIIGQNFMTGLRIIFDRERNILGWKKFNCYDVEDSNPLPVNPRNSSAPPSIIPAGGPNSYSPEATKDMGNKTQVTISIPPATSNSWLSQVDSMCMTLMLLFTVTIL